MKKLSAVVLAGGYGCFTGFGGARVSKLAARVSGKPMISRVLENLLDTSLFCHCYVVINNVYGHQIRCVLKGFPVTYVTQPHRVGSAGAVELALKEMGPSETEVMVAFGDMPLWESATFTTLAERHLQEDRPVMTMVTIPLIPGTNPARYGRILRSSEGRILGTIDDPALIPQGTEIRADEVNPSLYMARYGWLRYCIPKIPRFDKKDGFPAERTLQSAIHIASKEGANVAEVRLDCLEQALGVNSKAELREVRGVLERRIAKRMTA